MTNYKYKFVFKQCGDTIISKELVTSRHLEEGDNIDFGEFGRFKIHSIEHDLKIFDADDGSGDLVVVDDLCYFAKLVRLVEFQHQK